MKKLVLLPIIVIALVVGAVGCIVIPSGESDYGHHHHHHHDDDDGGLHVRPR